MNYACMTDATFCATKKVLKSKEVSSETKARREFIRNHNFSINVDESGNCSVKVVGSGK